MRFQHGNQRLRFARPRFRSSDDAGLVPLINVIFLMLIFFMVVGHMEGAAPFRVDPPVSRTDTHPSPEGLTLLLAADGRVAAGEEVMRLDTLEPWLQQWVQSEGDASENNRPCPLAVPTEDESACRGAPAPSLNPALSPEGEGDWERLRSDVHRSAPLPPVAVKADGRVPSRALRSLLDSLRRAGFRNVMLLTDQAR